ncbi:uncharacterized protein LOC123789312 [Ursus americanus]|uniref:uncharacterized protein LOC123789312 n=1 Tax=Ursus americanus TaxID=9643 RepID=UPI001E67B68B|nr:uncharacterized protein LOC123789312 [Ursus americanus]XP_057160122.1 uncharacterized protein LOC113259704 [Ursus arctos]
MAVELSEGPLIMLLPACPKQECSYSRKFKKERGSGCGADRGATSGTAAEPEAPPSASQSLRAPERRGADTLQQGEFEALWAPVEDSAEHGFPPFSCLRGSRLRPQAS